MKAPPALLVIQTAFIGDVVLVLPLLQVLREHLPSSRLGIVTVPSSAGVLQNHPALDCIYLYDKRGADRGIPGFRRVLRDLRRGEYDLALIPHRSLRSAALAWRAGIPRRVGFDRSGGRLLLTDTVTYKPESHEIQRNLSLLSPVGITQTALPLPRLYPSEHDVQRVEAILASNAPTGFAQGRMIALAPGSIWFTKRWPREHFERLAEMLVGDGFSVVLVGGEEDRALCQSITGALRSDRVKSLAGELSLLQSAALLGRCQVVVSNDSAPMHLATGIGTPVIGIFGATAPSFGFAPIGPRDRTLGKDGLPCRPCAIHGGRHCPIGTLECMWGVTPPQVHAMIQEILHGTARDS
jgi:heptosyltransferase-2